MQSTSTTNISSERKIDENEKATLMAERKKEWDIVRKGGSLVVG
jgi:hypothetical protein